MNALSWCRLLYEFTGSFIAVESTFTLPKNQRLQPAIRHVNSTAKIRSWRRRKQETSTNTLQQEWKGQSWCRRRSSSGKCQCWRCTGSVKDQGPDPTDDASLSQSESFRLPLHCINSDSNVPVSKDNLEPALRVQTERRLTSLQADLAKAEHRTVERKNGEKYHMVRL